MNQGNADVNSIFATERDLSDVFIRYQPVAYCDVLLAMKMAERNYHGLRVIRMEKRQTGIT